jgi:hypothetical protein
MVTIDEHWISVGPVMSLDFFTSSSISPWKSDLESKERLHSAGAQPRVQLFPS